MQLINLLNKVEKYLFENYMKILIKLNKDDQF